VRQRNRHYRLYAARLNYGKCIVSEVAGSEIVGRPLGLSMRAPVEGKRAPPRGAAWDKQVKDPATTAPARHEEECWLSLALVVVADSYSARQNFWH